MNVHSRHLMISACYSFFGLRCSNHTLSGSQRLSAAHSADGTVNMLRVNLFSCTCWEHLTWALELRDSGPEDSGDSHFSGQFYTTAALLSERIPQRYGTACRRQMAASCAPCSVGRWRNVISPEDRDELVRRTPDNAICSRTLKMRNLSALSFLFDLLGSG